MDCAALVHVASRVSYLLAQAEAQGDTVAEVERAGVARAAPVYTVVLEQVAREYSGIVVPGVRSGLWV